MTLSVQASPLFGTIAGWTYQTSNPNTTGTRITATGATGDEIEAVMKDSKTDSTSNLLKAAVGALTLPKTGDVLNTSLCLTSQVVKFTAENKPTLDLTGHSHAANNHTSAGMIAKYTWPTGVVPASVGGGVPALTALFGSNPTGRKSLTLTLSCNHVEQLGDTGDHLESDNNAGMLQIDCEFFDTVSLTAPTVGGRVMSQTGLATPTGNNAYNGTSFSFQIGIARD